MKKGIFGFGKKEYAQPQGPEVPSGQQADQNGIYINSETRQFVIKIFDGGKPEDLAAALGTLEIAKDVIKQTMSMWHARDAQRRGVGQIIVPKGNGNGHA